MKKLLRIVLAVFISIQVLSVSAAIESPSSDTLSPGTTSIDMADASLSGGCRIGLMPCGTGRCTTGSNEGDNCLCTDGSGNTGGCAGDGTTTCCH